jgi:Uma2 family endonuclease
MVIERHGENIEMVTLPKGEPYYTVEEYLEMDRNSDEKLEYVDGEIVAMTGASDAHAIITMNIGRVLGNQLLETNCIVRSSDMRIHIPTQNKYRYPDLTVTCDEAEFVDTKPESLLNPTVIVEVLSPSTQATDRGPKVDEYQNVPSLQAYVLVAQDRPWVAYFMRNPQGGWWYDTVEDMAATVVLENPSCELALAEVYRKVTFATKDHAPGDPI